MTSLRSERSHRNRFQVLIEGAHRAMSEDRSRLSAKLPISPLSLSTKIANLTHMAKNQTKRKYLERSKDVPVTQSMLFGVRDQLTEQIRAVSNHSDSKFHKVQSQLHEVKSELHTIKSELHRVAILMEEQNARNSIVMDGLTSLFTRQERVEADVADFRKIITK